MGQVYWYQEPSVERWSATFAAGCAAALLLDAYRRLRDTTLAAPIAWGCAACCCTIVAAWRDDPFADYATAVLFVAPTLAVLGAKRPQNGAWQFIVLTLVGVLMLPVLQGWAFGDEAPNVHPLFRWLLLAHVVVGVVNYLPTRYAAPAIVFGAAQAAAAGNYFPWPLWPDFSHTILAAACGFLAALVWARRIAGRLAVQPPGVRRLWLDFRDAYGVVWGLRVAERLNATGKKNGWPVEFVWDGVVMSQSAGSDGPDPEMLHRIERELRSLLRRFVSHEWIVRRLHG